MKTDSTLAVLMDPSGPSRAYVQKGDGPSSSLMKGSGEMRKRLIEAARDSSVIEIGEMFGIDDDLFQVCERLQKETNIPATLWLAAEGATSPYLDAVHNPVLDMIESFPFPGEIRDPDGFHPPVKDTLHEALHQLSCDADLLGADDMDRDKITVMSSSILDAQALIRGEGETDTALNPARTIELDQEVLVRILEGENAEGRVDQEAAAGLEPFLEAMNEIVKGTPLSYSNALSKINQMVEETSGPRSSKDRFYDRIASQFTESMRSWDSGLRPLDPVA